MYQKKLMLEGYVNAFAKSSRDAEVVTLQITEPPGFMRSSFSLGLPGVRWGTTLVAYLHAEISKRIAFNLRAANALDCLAVTL